MVDRRSGVLTAPAVIGEHRVPQPVVHAGAVAVVIEVIAQRIVRQTVLDKAQIHVVGVFRIAGNAAGAIRTFGLQHDMRQTAHDARVAISKAGDDPLRAGRDGEQVMRQRIMNLGIIRINIIHVAAAAAILVLNAGEAAVCIRKANRGDILTVKLP